MSFEKKVFAVFILLMGLVLTGSYIAHLLLIVSPRAATLEYRRMVADQEEVIRVKCTDPRKEFAEAEIKYLAKYKLFSDPASKYDILSSRNDVDSRQIAEASDLKIIEDLSIQSCKDAQAEVDEIIISDSTDYFMAHWKELMFNVK